MPARATTHMSSKGQIVVPKAMRDRRGWRSGEKLLVEERPEGVLIRKATDDRPSRMEDVFGCLGPAKRKVSIEEMNTAVDDYVRKHWGHEYDDID
jgi:AbrB family looped-hinge helix DNA binding protein